MYFSQSGNSSSKSFLKSLFEQKSQDITYFFPSTLNISSSSALAVICIINKSLEILLLQQLNVNISSFVPSSLEDPCSSNPCSSLFGLVKSDKKA